MSGYVLDKAHFCPQHGCARFTTASMLVRLPDWDGQASTGRRHSQIKLDSSQSSSSKPSATQDMLDTDCGP